MQIPVGALDSKFLFTGLFHLLLHIHLVPGARMTTVRAQERSYVYGVKKSLGINKIIPKHLDSGYPHDGCANKSPYPHHRRANKDSYMHNSNNQCINLRLQLSFMTINVQLMLV